MSDALTKLRSALALKQGMRRIPLTLETYQHQSVPLSSKLLLNMFVEQQPADARNQVALLPTPGFYQWLPVGTGPIHAINDDLPGVIFCVSGTHLWRINMSGGGLPVATDLGDVGTPSGGFSPDFLFYTIAVGPTAAVVCVPPKAFVSAGGGPVAEITTTWPSYGASSVTYLDGYFVFTAQLEPSQFFISELLDPTDVDALDFASLDAFPNAIFRVMTLGTELWFGGASGWEIWYNAGNVDFPFRRRPSGFIQRSVGSGKSIAKGDESLFWWSADGRVYRTIGPQQEERISTHGVEASLSTGIDSAYVFSQLGHIYYVLTLGDRSLVYDVLTKVWHTASSGADGTGPWRGSCSTANTGIPIIGDAVAGRLLVADPNLSTDMDVAVRRQVVLPPLYAGTKRAFCSRLEVEMAVGSVHTPGDITLEWSDDGGVNYTGSRTMNAGAVGQTRKRVFTTRLGSFRNRVFRLTSQHAMTVYAIDAEIVEGAH
jgi:hypothetical protein